MLVAQIQHVQRRTFDPALLVVCVSPNGLTALPVAPARNLAMISSSSLPNSNIQLITESFKFYLLMSLKKMPSYLRFLCHNPSQTTIIPQQGDFNYLQTVFPFLCFALRISQLLQ